MHQKNIKNTLITGGCGFIGSHFLEEYKPDDNENIFIVDDLSNGFLDNIPKNLKPNVTYMNTLNLDETNKKFDKIYHFASKINARSNDHNVIRENILSLQKVLKTLKSDGEIHFASTGGMYQDKTTQYETTEIDINNFYETSKFVQEEMVRQETSNHFIYRFSNVFGERQNPKESGIIAIIEKCLQNNKKMDLFNKGMTYRNYVYVKDLIHAIMKLDFQKSFGTYNISGDNCIRTLDLVQYSEVDYVISEQRPEPMLNNPSNNRLKSVINWQPTKTPFEYLYSIKD